MNKQMVIQIIKQVEKKFGRGKGLNWKNRDFEDLSFLIHQQTKVLISVATLKRIFGKVKTDKNYLPQESTLEALAKFADFNRTKKTLKIKSWIIGGIALLLALVMIHFFFTINIDSDEAIVKSLPPIGVIDLVKTEGSYPTTAYFNLDIPANIDSVFVKFGDGTKPIYVGQQKTLSHFYAFPGQFVAKLRTKDHVIDSSNTILVSTNGWQAMAYYFKIDQRKRYYPVMMSKTHTNGVFHVSRQTIASLGIDTTQIVAIRLDNYAKTEYNGDTFNYAAYLKTSSFWPAVRCYSTIITIQGAQGKIQFKLVGDGCSTFASYEIGEISKSGIDTDMSSLAVERDNWFNIAINNKEKEVHVLINEEEVFTESYQKTIGDIIGTTIEFHGSGFISQISLKADEVSLFEKVF